VIIRAGDGNRARTTARNVLGGAGSYGVDHPAITTVVRSACCGAGSYLYAAVRNFGSRPAVCTVSTILDRSAIKWSGTTAAQIRPYERARNRATLFTGSADECS